MTEPICAVEGLRVLVTGATGMFGLPLCRTLAQRNEVFAAARYSSADAHDQITAAGATRVMFDLADPDFAALPTDVDVVYHLGGISAASAERSRPQAELLRVNTFGTGRLFSRYRDCRAFVYASSSAVYAFQGDRPISEDDPYGLMDGVENYSLSKIGSELVLHALAEEFGTPTTILRVFQLYGPLGGSMVMRVDRLRRGEPIVLRAGIANRNSPMFEDDYVAKAVEAARVASTPPCVVNFAGSEATDIRTACDTAAELLGTSAAYDESDRTPYPLYADVGRMERLLGGTTVTVADGLRRVIESGAATRSSASLPGVKH